MNELREFKCKTCGENLDIREAVDGVIECEYCESVFTLPKEEASPEVLTFLRIGESYLDTCNWDGAYSAFKKAEEKDGTEPEAHWGLALASYKVQYLKDYVNNRLQPICHEINEKKFSDGADYKNALKYATAAQREEYEKKAAEIDYIKEEFFKLKQSGLNFDCFICVKVTDENGNKSEDYKDAEYIYDILKNRGYSPFFSERSIRNRTGADYEAMILYALYSSESMLVVCRDEKYLKTKWVRNEYTRFLRLINDEEKESDSITFVYYERPIEKLPGKRGKLQGIDFSRREAEGQIIDFVEKHTPQAKARREEEERKRKEEAEAQARLIKELREQVDSLKNNNANAVGGFSMEELLEKMEAARKEKERKRAEEEARRKAEEEARRKAEEINKLFSIEGTKLIKYKNPYGVTDVTIPDGITSIGDSAFEYCSGPKSITIPNSVTSIGDDAFSWCEGLKSITIPNSVTSIGYGAFFRCSGLETITVYKNSQNYTDTDGVLFNKERTELICFPAGRKGTYEIPDSVISIGEGAFFGCSGLNSITIPNGVASIGDFAFSACSGLETITIPNGVTSIGGGAFSFCSGLKSITIPNGVTSIGKNAFLGCEGLKSITIPNGVTSIGYNAFDGCKRLESITIPNGVTSIGEEAFKGCSGLEMITIPNSVTSIGDGAFKGCSGLEKVVIPKSFKKIIKNIFDDEITAPFSKCEFIYT